MEEDIKNLISAWEARIRDKDKYDSSYREALSECSYELKAIL